MKKQHPGGLKLSKNRTYYSHFASGVFVFFGTLFISGLASSSVFPVSDTSAQTISVENRNTGYFITVDAPASASIEVTPTASGSTAVSSASSVNVVTNAPGGYKLYLSATNVNLSASGVTPAFVPTSSTSLSDNSWGYSLDQSTWNAVTTSQTQIAQSSSSNYSNGTNTNVYYGVNANTNMPAATYSTTVTYTAVAEGIPEQYTMQGFTIAQCTAMSNGENITLMDIRDGKNYRVTKLADDNCWMTENLKLDGGRELTSADTNLLSGSTVTLPPNKVTGDVFTSNSIDIANNVTTADGNLYNWCAATLLEGNNCATTVEPTEDICPKGWRLPSNSGSISYNNLFSLYGLSQSSSTSYSNIIETSPLYFTRTGVWDSGSAVVSERNGTYWSRTPYSNTHAYFFTYDVVSPNFLPQYNFWKNRGAGIRCVLESRSMADITYMQDMTSAICNNASEHYSKNLTDNRDSKSYRVTKLKDGNCWMTQNLALDGNRTLHFYDSNVKTDVSLPANISLNTTVVDTSMQILPQQSGGDGNYYNWCAQTAISNCSEIIGAQSTSICPRGFVMPYLGQYNDLASAYSIDVSDTNTAISKLQASPIYMSGSGYYTGGSGAMQGNGYASYWLNDTISSSNAYYFAYWINHYVMQYYQPKGVGRSMRCLAPGA